MLLTEPSVQLTHGNMYRQQSVLQGNHLLRKIQNSIEINLKKNVSKNNSSCPVVAWINVTKKMLPFKKKFFMSACDE